MATEKGQGPGGCEGYKEWFLRELRHGLNLKFVSAIWLNVSDLQCVNVVTCLITLEKI